MRILVVGDIIGKPGRLALKKYMEKHEEEYDFVIVNGENSAGGFGITKKITDELYDMGVDLITGGNHTWDKKEIYPVLDKEIRIIRPLNYGIDNVPGRGYIILNTKNGKKIGVINLQGRVFMPELDSPFKIVEQVIEEVMSKSDVVVVDFHAEATSEKMALGWFLDGRASLVFGTHTHVMTADNRILHKGTGYISDIGMTGGFDGVIGSKKEKIIGKFMNYLPTRFEVCNDNIRFNGIDVTFNSKTGKCLSIDRIDIGLEEI
ncbi:TIGR00282 family metallophosphoesterase [Haliovirga abyssi]|uniref:Metallophosphoesterase n=1 Tax=Haliovirga abyssi TaxID=2996794 RepID=A0AAU9D4Q0_9FUSO|nr:TIGR00282 family metallophosphoesterase [Haliovirga abyssi]BDU51011.1 metallophosphoesterase [Haliovirga abyssi]